MLAEEEVVGGRLVVILLQIEQQPQLVAAREVVCVDQLWQPRQQQARRENLLVAHVQLVGPEPLNPARRLLQLRDVALVDPGRDGDFLLDRVDEARYGLERLDVGNQVQGQVRDQLHHRLTQVGERLNQPRHVAQRADVSDAGRQVIRVE